MPNWCEGTFKVRGTRQNIIGYLQELLQNPLDGKIDFSDNGDEITFAVSGIDYFYLKDTRRAFIEQKAVSFYIWEIEDETDEVHVVSIDDFKQAWGITAENYTELSKKHDVDLHIFGYELGMEFTQEVEIHKGKIVKDIELKYDDYDWEVPFSNLGG